MPWSFLSVNATRHDNQTGKAFDSAGDVLAVREKHRIKNFNLTLMSC
jgi:hypothetical protein